MDELITWFRAVLDRIEYVAQRAGAYNPTWTYDRETFTVSSDGPGGYVIAARKDRGHEPLNDVDGEHIALNDPAVVLARVAADRRILDLVDKARAWTQGSAGATAGYAAAITEDTVRLLALPYAGWPGYREEWRP
ncbi:DUF6221 family protein [Micromonospora sp. NPDC050417]|uniref:DUF6221 family protein n=1 Tax=Micromonospora sp. NPDC050417 TaxID=3364280 RepID=UPI0037B4B458